MRLEGVELRRSRGVTPTSNQPSLSRTRSLSLFCAGVSFSVFLPLAVQFSFPPL